MSPAARPAARSPRTRSVVHQADVMATVVREINLANRKTNTKKAYDPKVAEYNAFCDYVYSDLHVSTRYTVTGDKMFRFLFFHSMRNKYDVGGERRHKAHGFDGAAYDAVWQQYDMSLQALSQNAEDPGLFKDPENPLGYDQVNTYKAVVRGIHAEQVQNNANNLAYEFVFTHQSKALLKMVKERRARVRRATYQEKLEGDFSPFTSIGQVDKIEQKFWDNGKRSSRAAFCAMRNRSTFLSCYSGVLRHESMFLGELSDMVGLEHERARDAHRIFVMVMQIATGENFCCCVN
jgi:hypothetical protein